jgi:hypothetical protein
MFESTTDLYEQWAAEALSAANAQGPGEDDWRDAYEELAAELFHLANLSRVGGVGDFVWGGNTVEPKPVTVWFEGPNTTIQSNTTMPFSF